MLALVDFSSCCRGIAYAPLQQRVFNLPSHCWTLEVSVLGDYKQTTVATPRINCKVTQWAACNVVWDWYYCLKMLQLMKITKSKSCCKHIWVLDGHTYLSDTPRLEGHNFFSGPSDPPPYVMCGIRVPTPPCCRRCNLQSLRSVFRTTSTGFGFGISAYGNFGCRNHCRSLQTCVKLRTYGELLITSEVDFWF